MKSTIYLALLLFFVQKFGQADRCSDKSCPKKDGTEWIHEKKECEKTECCWDTGKCYRQAKKNIKEFKELPEIKQKKIEFPHESVSERRFLGLARPPPYCDLPKPFPLECVLDRNYDPEEPPLNIPYCVRIPCSASRGRQNLFDQSSFDCATQPGCYFDHALFHYRQAFFAPIFPGVPVCHLAIRTPVMKDKARHIINEYGFWNPYFTECLLSTFRREIFEGPLGCKLLPLLKEFGVLPKLAGWKGINYEECAWIGACYIRREGCFLPVNPYKLSTEPGHKYTTNIFTIPYGRPKCQHFNPTSPYTVLKSYHNCLAAGCSIDSRITDKYYHYLFNLGNTMTTEDHWAYWEQVMNGLVGVNNIDGIPWKYEKDVRFNAPTPSPPKLSNFELLKARTFASSSKGGHGLPCGFAFKPYDGRPCHPPKIKDINLIKFCPFEPFHIRGYPKLTGSLDGCCDINPCYILKKDIPNASSGPSHYYTEWSFYSPCSAKCGRGVQTRYRSCHSVRKDICKDDLKQVTSCSVSCATWTEWSRWSGCETFCGMNERYRRCHGPGKCEGRSSESKQCNPLFCNK